MRTRGRDRIGLAEADRLVAGEPPPPEHRGLSVLLAAAAAEPFPEELADETAAVAGFARARRGAGPATTTADRRPAAAASGRCQPIPGPHRPLRPRVPLPRATVFRVAVGLAVVATGGTAFAAATGSLPANIQEQAHQLLAPLGVPAPSTAAGSSAPRPHTSASPNGGAGQPSGSPAPGTTGRTDGPDLARATELCRDWEAAQKHPHGKPMPAESRRALAAAAGGEPNIAGYCAVILGGQPGQATPSQTPTPATGRTHPGGGDDNKGGGGDNNKGGGGRPSDRPRKTRGVATNG